MHMEDSDRLRRLVIGRLESLARAGVLQLPKTAYTQQPRSAAQVDEKSPALAPNRTEVETMPVKNRSSDSSKSAALFDAPDAMPPAANTAPTLEVLQQQVATCPRCDELARTRTQTVFGTGNPRARLCIMGEAPGADEDRTGVPFVGRAGQLLTKIIEACHMKREDVFILNMIKCRPPGNRNPLPEELANCRPYLDRQLELIQPEYICCLGAVAAQNLLQTTVSISKLRGKVHNYRGIKVVCTYHPAYLLRNPAAKKDCWEDMKGLMREMGIEL